MNCSQDSKKEREAGLPCPAPSLPEERLLQELLVYYRHAMVGRWITGIIHTLNSPLQVLLMQADLVARKLQEEEQTLAPQLPPALVPIWQGYVDYRRRKNQQLVEITDTLQKLINWLQYRTLHAAEHSPQEIDLNALMQTELTGYQLEPFFKNRVAKKWQQQDQLPPITGFYVDFSQSFCHLVDNALDALRQVDEPVLTLATYLADGHRVIAVGDNGPGLPPALQEKIFAPFFTTKNAAAQTKKFNNK